MSILKVEFVQLQCYYLKAKKFVPGYKLYSTLRLYVAFHQKVELRLSFLWFVWVCNDALHSLLSLSSQVWLDAFEAKRRRRSLWKEKGTVTITTSVEIRRRVQQWVCWENFNYMLYTPEFSKVWRSATGFLRLPAVSPHHHFK